MLFGLSNFYCFILKLIESFFYQLKSTFENWYWIFHFYCCYFKLQNFYFFIFMQFLSLHGHQTFHYFFKCIFLKNMFIRASLTSYSFRFTNRAPLEVVYISCFSIHCIWIILSSSLHVLQFFAGNWTFWAIYYRILSTLPPLHFGDCYYHSFVY